MIPLIIQIDSDEVLSDYGAGALVRIQSAIAKTGPFADLASPTVAVVAGISEYRFVDPAGTTTTWYRDRFENAGGSEVSAWSDPFLGAARPYYLSLEDLKALVSTTLSDEALLILLDAAREEIVRYAGAGGNVTEILDGHGDLLQLSAPAESITSVVVNDVTTLAATDYELISPTLLLRLPSHQRWGHRVRVAYTQVDDSALRQRVQADLVRHAITSAVTVGGLTGRTIGTWSETYASSSSATAMTDEKSDILSVLDYGVPIL